MKRAKPYFNNEYGCNLCSIETLVSVKLMENANILNSRSDL